MRVVSWFSCGAASAVATHLILKKYPDAVIANIDTGSEHPDNARFMADCERWYGREIVKLKSLTYKDVDDVIERRHYMAGPHGAPCTGELKKQVRYSFQQPGDLHIFGFHHGEDMRAERIAESELIDVETPLITGMLSHSDCRALLRTVGIKLPVMYGLGFKHNNCLGCVKAAAPGYWNKTRQHFPDVFARRARQEREVGYAMTKVKGQPIFLDELDPTIGNYELEQDLGCGILCQIALTEG